MNISRRNLARAAVQIIESGASGQQTAERLNAFLGTYGLSTMVPGLCDELVSLAQQQEREDKAYFVFSSDDSVSKDIVEKLLVKFCGSLDVEYKIQYNPAIIGGFMLTYRGVVYDYSLQNSLAQLKSHYQLAH